MKTSELKKSDAYLLFVLLVGMTLVKAWMLSVAGIELHYEEAQYWEWSQQLDWSYYSKGPLVAWLIALSEFIFGHGEWQLRLFAWLAHGVFISILFYFSYEVWQDRAAAWWAAIIASCIPIYFTLGSVMTTDIFVFTLWAWALWAMYRALFAHQPHAWYHCGAAVGIGALAKLSIGLLPFFGGLLVIFQAYRSKLLNRHLAYALILMLFIMAPLILWNAANDWVMLRHEGGHIQSGVWSTAGLGAFVTGQMIALSPILFVLGIFLCWRLPQQQGQRFIWTVSLLVLAFFVIKTLGAKVQPNWPAPAYIGFLVLFSGHIARASRTLKIVGALGCVMAVIIIVLSFFPHLFGFSARQDPYKDTRAWRQAVDDIQAQLQIKGQNIDFILVPNYKLAGELAFYWQQKIPVYVSGSYNRRFNQHDLWPSIDREQGRRGLYVSATAGRPELLEQAFASCRDLAPVPAVTASGGHYRTLYASLCENYQIMSWPQPTHY